MSEPIQHNPLERCDQTVRAFVSLDRSLYAEPIDSLAGAAHLIDAAAERFLWEAKQRRPNVREVRRRLLWLIALCRRAAEELGFEELSE